MFLLLMIPVVVLVAAVHRVLQLYAPSNLLAARVRKERPRIRVIVGLVVMAAMLVLVAHLLATWAATRGPGWLNLVVVIAIWDAFKFAALAVIVALRRARVALRQASLRGRSLVAP